MAPQRTDWQLVGRGSVSVSVMLGHCPDTLLPSATGDHAYFAYLHAEWAQRGAVVLHPLIDRDWGMREFSVATPDGRRLMVGEILP